MTNGNNALCVFLLASLLGISLADSNVTVSPVKTENPSQNADPVVKILDMPKKMAKETLKSGTVHVFHRRLDSHSAMGLMRISVEIPDPKKYKNTGSSPILEVAVSNGRDNFLLKLPVIYPNVILWSDGKLLDPLISDDFGPLVKRKHIPESKLKAGNLTQNLIITVQSRLHEDIDYKIHLQNLDAGQYVLKFDKEDKKILANQHLTIVKPIGFYLDSVEQNVREFQITVTSGDDICALLVTVPANESLYDRRIDSNEVDNRRSMTFTRRADVFFSESEVQTFKYFKIFAFINPDDSACSLNTSRKSINENKQISFEFVKTYGSSYFVPISSMIFFFLIPGMILIPYQIMAAVRSSASDAESLSVGVESPEAAAEGQLISFGSPDHSAQEPPQHEDSPQSDSFPGPVEIHVPALDSLSLHGEMLRYPIAIILPVLMHFALEFHKFTTSSMANRDEMCFHNHACAKPFGELRAWNNVISNIGYAIYGMTFVGITLGRRQRLIRGTGTYECTLLDVTIGVFMVLQAVASATYHICPSDVAFQFDTPCIQVICGLLILRQWLVRLESPSAAYSNILLVGVVSLNFLISALSSHPSVRYLVATLHLTIIISICIAKRSVLSRNSSLQKISLPFSVVFCLTNTALIFVYISTSWLHLNQISTYCFILNCLMYLVYYTLMKTVCNERISTIAAIYGGLAFVCWIVAGTFFLQDGTDWTKTAAASRALNKPCLLLDFFGSHDLWHIFGALAGLFTFLFVSLVDDNLLNTPKHDVLIF